MPKKKKVADIKDATVKEDNANKIIYFDKETIRNILKEYNKGSKQTITNTMSSRNIFLKTKSMTK